MSRTAYEDGPECSETSAYKLQTPGNYPKESIQHTEHGESLKSRKSILVPFLNAAGLSKNLLAVYCQYLVLHSGDMRRNPDV